MKVLKDHYEGKPTILINDRIINGCQDFTMTEAGLVLRKYSVPAYTWHEVITAYTGVSTELEMMPFINSTCPYIISALVKHGTEYVRDIMMRSADDVARKHVAIYGSEKQRGELINDDNYVVRMMVARHTDSEEHRRLLAKDDNYVVRANVVRCTNSTEIRRMFVDDSSDYVRTLCRDLLGLPA